MKAFINGYKVNFIDENNLCVGYDTRPGPTEYAGWFISPIASTPVESQELPDKHEVTEWTNYTFDKSYKLEVDDNSRDLHMVIFRLTKDDYELFLHLFNVHNGYYSHGFTFTDNKKKILEGQI